MTFDLHIQLDSQTPEGRIVESIVSEYHISPEEAVLSVLRRMGNQSPAEEMWGVFSSPEDSAMLEEIVEEAYQRRQLDQPREFGY